MSNTDWMLLTIAFETLTIAILFAATWIAIRTAHRAREDAARWEFASRDLVRETAAATQQTNDALDELEALFDEALCSTSPADQRIVQLFNAPDLRPCDTEAAE